MIQLHNRNKRCIVYNFCIKDRTSLLVKLSKNSNFENWNKDHWKVKNSKKDFLQKKVYNKLFLLSITSIFIFHIVCILALWECREFLIKKHFFLSLQLFFFQIFARCLLSASQIWLPWQSCCLGVVVL